VLASPGFSPLIKLVRNPNSESGLIGVSSLIAAIKPVAKSDMRPEFSGVNLRIGCYYFE
jgi:hypothetical protein